MNKKPSLTILFLFFTALLLAACSSSGEEPPTPTPELTATVATTPEPPAATPVDEAAAAQTEELGIVDTIASQTPEPTATPGPVDEAITGVLESIGLAGATILGLSVESLINLLISALIVVLGYIIGTWVKRTVQHWVTERTTIEFGIELIEAIGSPLRWLVVLLALQFATNRLAFLTAEFKTTLSTLYFIAAAVLLLQIGWRLIDLGAEQATVRTIDAGRENELAPIVSLVKALIRVVVILFFISVVLANFGVDLTVIIAALGIGGLALSLALRGSIENAIAGITILINQPFRVGDRIDVPVLGTWADVVEINLGNTKALTRDNRMIIVPNITLTEAEIVNYSYPDSSYRLQLDVGVGYGTDIDFACQVLTDAVSQADGLQPDKPIDCIFNEMGDSSMIFRIRWWLADYKDKRRSINQVNTLMQRAMDEAGIESPFPTQSLLIQPDSEDDDAPPVEPTKDS